MAVLSFRYTKNNGGKLRILIARLGAYGDVIVTTPLVRHLHEQGHKIVYVCNERGAEVLKGNPHIETIHEQPTDSVKTENLTDHYDYLKRKYKCEKIIDLSESIEVSLSQHPRSSNYKLSKPERIKRFNRNFYEYAFELVGESWDSKSLIPNLFFSKEEIDRAEGYLKKGQFNILVGMSGSGTNKVYPWTETLCETIVQQMPDVHIITVGDAKCELIEPIVEGRITNLSGKVPMRTSMALTGLVDLVISPDTGLLHASGCYDTPKIGLLGHNTIETVTKHFRNDHSIEADSKKAECAPCLYLVYNMKLQCPLSLITGSSICMAEGIDPALVLSKVKEIYAKSKNV